MEWIPTRPKMSGGTPASSTVPIDQTEPCDWIRWAASSHGLPGPVPQQNYSHSLQGKAQQSKGGDEKAKLKRAECGHSGGKDKQGKEETISFSSWHVYLYDISIALNWFVYTEIEIYHRGHYNVQLNWFKGCWNTPFPSRAHRSCAVCISRFCL